MNTLRTLGQQPGPTLASFGQKYQDMPPATFDQRFGPYQVPQQRDITKMDSAELLRLLRQQMDEQQLRTTPEAIIPGQELVDPLGYRGQREPNGYYLLRGI